MKNAFRYLRLNHMPHIWCAGCGNGIVLGALIRALDQLNIDQNNLVCVSGIGCSSRSAGYIDANTVHTAHGRALPFATGIKLAKPQLTVLVITGDGDGLAIGGNHFIHAARRNIDITVIIFNNNTYGMTSGQSSPLMARNMFSSTSIYGNIEEPFDVCKLAEAAGATFVARGTTFHTHQLQKLISSAITHKGFSVVEAITACPTYFGKFNNNLNAIKMLQLQRDNAISVKDAALMTKEQRKDKFIVGELLNIQRPECVESYAHLFERVYGT